MVWYGMVWFSFVMLGAIMLAQHFCWHGMVWYGLMSSSYVMVLYLISLEWPYSAFSGAGWPAYVAEYELQFWQNVTWLGWAGKLNWSKPCYIICICMSAPWRLGPKCVWYDVFYMLYVECCITHLFTLSSFHFIILPPQTIHSRVHEFNSYKPEVYTRF